VRPKDDIPPTICARSDLGDRALRPFPLGTRRDRLPRNALLSPCHNSCVWFATRSYRHRWMNAGRPAAGVPIGSSDPGGLALTVDMVSTQTRGVTLYWIPLGSGGHVVRWNGKAYEAIKALTERRGRRSLYHSALEVTTADARYVVEVTPVPPASAHDRGVVGEGAVGSRWLGWLRLFRYEIRRWRDGTIPDAADAGTVVVRVCDDAITSERILDLLPSVPKPVWGRDELGTGDMWNSNSVTSWVLATAGIEIEGIGLPDRGRAPGWDAGLVVARRSHVPTPREMTDVKASR
jgi:hypothetical protein